MFCLNYSNQRFVASNMGLHCLLMSILRVNQVCLVVVKLLSFFLIYNHLENINQGFLINVIQPYLVFQKSLNNFHL